MSGTHPVFSGNYPHERSARACRRAAGLAIGLIGLAACAGQPSLVPAPDAERVSPGGTIARDADAGVTVTVDPDAWRGSVNIKSAVTPMQVRIENRSGHKLRIRYDDFSLISGPDRYVALPPYDIRGTVAGRSSPRRYPPVGSLAYAYNGFYVSPFYHSFYPGLAVWHGDPFLLDRYYDHYYPYWERMRIELPTPEMLRYALPEGVLEDGGTVAGFLYFEPIDTEAEEPQVTFEANVVDIVSDETLTTLEVPFVVRKAD